MNFNVNWFTQGIKEIWDEGTFGDRLFYIFAILFAIPLVITTIAGVWTMCIYLLRIFFA